MFYLASKFHGNRVNTFGFMEGGLWSPPPPPAQELQKSPGGIGLTLSYINKCNVVVVAAVEFVVFIYKISFVVITTWREIQAWRPTVCNTKW